MKVVPDSNLVVAQVIPLAYSQAATRRMQEWLDRDVDLVMPSLAAYEIVSTLRKASVVMKLSADQVRIALESILALRIREVPPTPALHQKALVWAMRLNQTVAYDAAFLALAESEGAEFWTADRRLADAARDLGIAWVHNVDEV